MAMITKTLADAVKACGGDASAHAILDRYLQQQVRNKENRALAGWARKQANAPDPKTLLAGK